MRDAHIIPTRRQRWAGRSGDSGSGNNEVMHVDAPDTESITPPVGLQLSITLKYYMQCQE